MAFVANGSILPRASGRSDKQFLGSVSVHEKAVRLCGAHVHPSLQSTGKKSKNTSLSLSGQDVAKSASLQGTGAEAVEVPGIPAPTPFVSPPCLAVAFTLPYSGRSIRGMLVKEGVTIIAGGGFHGKSTLLRAIASGVYVIISFPVSTVGTKYTHSLTHNTNYDPFRLGTTR